MSGGSIGLQKENACEEAMLGDIIALPSKNFWGMYGGSRRPGWNGGYLA